MSLVIPLVPPSTPKLSRLATELFDGNSPITVNVCVSTAVGIRNTASMYHLVPLADGLPVIPGLTPVLIVPAPATAAVNALRVPADAIRHTPDCSAGKSAKDPVPIAFVWNS